jgi:hypothetical protein
MIGPVINAVRSCGGAGASTGVRGVGVVLVEEVAEEKMEDELRRGSGRGEPSPLVLVVVGSVVVDVVRKLEE